jgi:hypothetical protein
MNRVTILSLKKSETKPFKDNFWARIKISVSSFLYFPMNLVYTSEQQAIIQCIPNRDIAINSGPGCSKTTTMLARIHYMWKGYQVPLNQIALFTFNNFLAQDMRDKLSKFGIATDSLVWCGTLHAFCYRETKSMDNLALWSQKFSRGYPVHDEYAPREIKRFREHCANLKYIIFDEYQDANTEIAEVLRILSMNRYLTIVGDERQQIYGFRDADSSYLMELKPNYTRFSLSMSFRCNENICRFLSRLYPDYPMIKSNRPGLAPLLYRSTGKAMNNPDIIETVIGIVTNALAKGYTIAILAPTLRSEKSEMFLNDVYSNINHRCHLTPDQRFSLLGEDAIMAANVVSTIHGVKGREYDVVILLNAVDSPSLFDPKEEGDLCKFFVACSRARHELHLFEHLFGASGSLSWITDNEELTIPGNTIHGIDKRRVQPRARKEGLPKPWVRSVSDYIRGLKSKHRDAFLNQYTEPELINKDAINLEEFFFSLESTDAGRPGHVSFDGMHRSRLLERLIELVVNVKLTRHFREISFPIYINKWEWKRLIANPNLLPRSVSEKAAAVVESTVYKFTYKRGRFAIGFEDDSHQLITTQNHCIDENSIISDMVCDEYYRHLPTVQAAVRQLKGKSFNSITPECLRHLWTLTKFESLIRLNINQFRSPDPDPDIFQRLVYVLNNNMALESYRPFLYNLTVEGTPPEPPTESVSEGSTELELLEDLDIIPSSTILPVTPSPVTPGRDSIKSVEFVEFMKSMESMESIKSIESTPRKGMTPPNGSKKGLSEEVKIRAQFDLLSPHGLIAVRCGNNSRQIEDIWLEQIINNIMFASIHYKTWCEDPYEKIRETMDRPLTPGSMLRSNLYYYNPLTGELWQRRFKDPEMEL